MHKLPREEEIRKNSYSVEYAWTIRAVSELIPKLSLKYTVLSPKIKLNDFIVPEKITSPDKVNSEINSLIKCAI